VNIGPPLFPPPRCRSLRSSFGVWSEGGLEIVVAGIRGDPMGVDMTHDVSWVTVAGVLRLAFFFSIQEGRGGDSRGSLAVRPVPRV